MRGIIRVIVAGTRDTPDNVARKALRAGFDRQALHGEIEAIATGESGAVDRLGRVWADHNGVAYVPFPADWDKFGKFAGPERNERMARWAAGHGRGVLVAVWDGKSKGTADMILAAARNGLDLEVQLVSKFAVEVST